MAETKCPVFVLSHELTNCLTVCKPETPTFSWHELFKHNLLRSTFLSFHCLGKNLRDNV